MKINDLVPYIRKYRVIIPLILAALCLILSFFELTSHNRRMLRLVDVEKVLHNKQVAIEKLALRELEEDASQWLSDKGVEEDMVIYKYVEDSLVSWVNTFPIINDSYSPDVLFPNFSFFSRNRLLQQPLTGVNESEQYMNLGSGWYVVRVYSKGNVNILTGILIQTDFPFSNNFVNSHINKDLKLPNYCSIVPLNLDEGFIVFGKNDGVLFTILSDTSKQTYSDTVILRWFALFFLMASTIIFFWFNRQFKYALSIIAGLTVVRLLSSAFSSYLQLDGLFFSPLLYAGGFLENSLAAMMLNTLFVYLGIWSIYMARFSFVSVYSGLKRPCRITVYTLLVLTGIGIILLVHHTLRSLTMDSNITLELFKLDEITWFSVLAYFSITLLFLALFLLVRVLMLVSRAPVQSFFSGTRFTFLFVFIAALYSLLTVMHYGKIKEYNLDQVWTQKMAVERDLEVEMQLRRVESLIAMDPILSIMIQMEQDHDMILSRIKENYFSDFLQRYQIQITICEPGDVLMVAGLPGPVSCYNFFHSELLRNGTPLADDSHFYNVDNKLGNISYIGVFTYYSYGGSQDLYIELDSHYIKDALGYPSLLSDKSQLDKFKLPYDYSYAKYIDDKLISNSGDYPYASKITPPGQDGFYQERIDRHLHFTYKTENKVLIITRPLRSPFPYIVSLSYLFLFYGFIFSIILGVFRTKEIQINLPRNSFRRKITWLLVGSLVVALVFMAFGSLGFGLQLYDETNEKQMRDQMQAAQASLEEYIRHADRSNDPTGNAVELMNTMNRLSSNIQIQVNLYDPHGRLMRSSQPEIFERHLLSARMNGTAFMELNERESRQFTHKEQVGNLTYYSMYAPLYNTYGTLVAYINVPYLSGQTDVTKDTSSIVAAVVNLYLLLLLAAIVMSFTFSNQITRPLVALEEKLSQIDVTKKAEHIVYTSEDELGMLVAAYNKMADDLDESTRRLAQSEREQAWREMARQIAHEIKNPLTPMRLSIQHLIRLKQEGSSKWTEHFDKVAASLLEQINILSETATEFSNFSRFHSEDPTEIELNSLIREQIVLFSTSEHIKIHFEPSAQEARIVGQRSQIIRILVNLLGNAIQAVEAQAIGVITVRVEEEGDQYLIQIADNGPGVAPENRDRLFKPNFTTKSSGTGLGLAICRGILDQYQGTISYSSSEWGGACFNIRIPKK